VTGLRKVCDPVELGQSRGGLVLAAVLIACWQLCAPVQAAPAPDASGFSENDYFRLEWDYDLDRGTGTIRFRALRDDGSWHYDDILLDHTQFTTRGLPFSSILGDAGQPLFDPPTFAGMQGGLPLYAYDLLAPYYLGHPDYPMPIRVTYPTDGVELRATEFNFEGYRFTLSGVAGPGILIPPEPMAFVTIQPIPEPAAAAALAAGAGALLATQRRRRDDA